MQISSEWKRSVVYIGIMRADETLELRGTGILLGQSIDRSIDANMVYIATARHVVEGIESRGVEFIHIRLNLIEQYTTVRIPVNQVVYHSDTTVDLALLPFGLNEEFDHVAIDIEGFLNDDRIIQNQIRAGDEVFITGLFRHHHGTIRNVPIIRCGNLATFPAELVQTQHALREAYLIEVRSIGGLSGCPVFIHLGIHRRLDQGVQQATGEIIYLLGIMHGHYDTQSSSLDEAQDNSEEEFLYINSGIAIVTPIYRLEEMLEYDIVQDWHQRVISERQ